MRPTLSDVARAAGVAKSTASMALSNTGRINSQTRARVKKIADELNYRPNCIAQSLTKGQSQFVAVVAAPAVIPMFHLVVEPIEKRLQEAGYSMLFYSSTETEEGQRKCAEQLFANRVAGVIAVAGSGYTDSQGYKELVNSGVSLVVINRCLDGLDVPQIVCDDYRAARFATEYLISLGHKRIAHLTIPEASSAGRERGRGFHDAITEAGLEVIPSFVIETGLNEDAGMEAMSTLLHDPNPPTAVVTRQDAVAMGAMYSAFEHGISVPEQISIIGNGDIWRCNLLRVPLTTIRHPMENMAIKGVTTLLDMLNNRPVQVTTEIMDFELVVRSSCAPPPHDR